MRILFIEHSSYAAGAAMSLRYLAAGLVGRGHDVHVATCWPSPELETFHAAGGVQVHPLRGFPTIQHTTASWLRFSHPRSMRAAYQTLRRYPRAAADLRVLVDRLQPDIVHLNSATLLPAAVALRKSPPVVVWHVRESPPFDGRGFRTRWVAKIMKSDADETIFISEHDRRMWARDRFGTVVYCCTPTGGGVPEVTGDVLRKELGLEPCHRVILFVGGFQEIKGFQVLCRAFQAISDVVPEARLVIIGASVPPPSSRLASFARRYGPYIGVRAYHDRCQLLLHSSSVLQSRCVVKPLVPNVADYLDLCEFLVFPSVRPHFARPVIEAALAGKPSIASNFAGIAEVVNEGDGAMLIPPGDVSALSSAMLAMLRDPVAAHRMGERAKAFAGERFTVDRHVDSVEAVYQSVLHRRRSPSTASRS